MPVSDTAFEAMAARLNDLERDLAVARETWKSVDSRLAKIEAVMSRLQWILIIGIGSAFVGWIINGGLANVAG